MMVKKFNAAALGYGAVSLVWCAAAVVNITLDYSWWAVGLNLVCASVFGGIAVSKQVSHTKEMKSDQAPKIA